MKLEPAAPSIPSGRKGLGTPDRQSEKNGADLTRLKAHIEAEHQALADNDMGKALSGLFHIDIACVSHAHHALLEAFEQKDGDITGGGLGVTPFVCEPSNIRFEP